MLNTSEFFYPRFTADPRKYQPELKTCIENTIRKILAAGRQPIMLLGKIQSGKTRAFMGVLSLAFDNNFDVCVVLTKGTKALAKQTIERIQSEFEEFIPQRIQVYDIMGLPVLSGYARKTKFAAAERWVRAVNYWGKMGQWKFHDCLDPNHLRSQLEHFSKEEKVDVKS
jgi:hypothetical protein